MERLSQKEIDELLSAISTKPVENISTNSRRIKIYDFMRPDKLSKEALRNICFLMENFSRDASRVMSLKLKNTFKMHVASVDQLTYEELLRSIPTPTEMSIINIDKYRCLFEVNPSISFSLLGLSTDNEKKKPFNRDLSDKEITLWQNNYVKPLLKTLEDAIRGSNLKTFERGKLKKRSIKNLKFENNPIFANIMQPSDMTCVITLEVYHGDEGGMINICLPWELAYELSEELMGREVKKSTVQSINPQLLNDTQLPIEVRLGATKKSIKDVLGFGEGTIIELDKLAGEPMDIVVNGKVMAHGEVVVIDENFGVRITDIVESIEE